MKWTQTNRSRMPGQELGCLPIPKKTKPSAVGLDLTSSSTMTSFSCRILWVTCQQSTPQQQRCRVTMKSWHNLWILHTISFETSYIDHREDVSGCWPPRLVCGVWRDFRRIDHWCDGRAQIQSCWQASQDRVRGDVEASRLEGVLLWSHVNHGAEIRHLTWKNVLKSISTFHEVSQTSFTALMDDASRAHVLLLFTEHIDAIGISNSLTAFWTSYHGMAEITLGLLLAAR